ncbi:hypothetical protein CBR_g46233 [Chara braunii]|uniref:DUF659 domain-containing protein n=1 Tax=Chara braunii TaxID=69332 RepID=A0A388K3Q6_CHABU|nr:hypothetical protein CBR_g46233 [Chara braunii]|eukprot:GBG64690.1 hypothetical protein CBR_g46233 [Chara braunii]
MAGSQFSPLTPRERELRELQQVERIRERLERELKQATDREREIKNRTARLDTLEADKAELEGLDDSGMNGPMKVLRNNMLSLHAHVDSRLDFMQSTLDQILDALTRPGFRPPAQSPLPLSAMSGPFPVQVGTQPSGTSAAVAQTVASSSSGPAVGATPPQQTVQQSGQPQGQWYPKTPMKPPLAFSGERKDEKLNTWLRTVPVWVKAKTTLPEDEVVTVASYLEGKAAKWLDGIVVKAGEARLEYHSFETLSRKALDLEATLGNAQPTQNNTKKKKSHREWKKKGAKLMMVESDGTQTEIDELTDLMDYTEFDGEEVAEGSTLVAVVKTKAGGRGKGQPRSQGKAASNQSKVAEWVKAGLDQDVWRDRRVRGACINCGEYGHSQMPKAGADAIKRHFENVGVHGEPGKGNYIWKCLYCELQFPGSAKHFTSTTKGPRCNINRLGSRLSVEEKERRELGRLEAIALMLGKAVPRAPSHDWLSDVQGMEDVDVEDECNSPQPAENRAKTSLSTTAKVRQSTLEEGGAIISKNEEAQRSIDDWLVYEGVRFNMVRSKDKGAAAYFDILSESIREVGKKSVVGVIMDNVAVCVRADRLVEDTFPTIFDVPCAAHCLDLVLHDVGKMEWVARTVGKANDLVKFIMNHQRVRDVYYIHSGGRQLLRPASTRFATNFHMLDRLKKQQKALVAMVTTDERWTATLVPHGQRSTFHEMEDVLLDAAGFWKDVNKAINAVYDIVLLLKLVDGNGPTISKVYAKMDRIVERLRVNKDLTAEDREEIEVMVMRKWNAMTTPLHCPALFFDPEYRSSEPHNDPEIQDGFYTWVYTWLKGSSQEVCDQVEYEQIPERAKDLVERDDPPTEEEQKEAKERVKLVERRLKSLTSAGDDVVPPADGGGDEDGDEVVVLCREECNLEEIEEGHCEDWSGLTKAGNFLLKHSQTEVRRRARTLGAEEHMRAHRKGGGDTLPRGAATIAPQKETGTSSAQPDPQRQKKARGRPRKTPATDVEGSDVATAEGENNPARTLEENLAQTLEKSGGEGSKDKGGKDEGVARKRPRDDEEELCTLAVTAQCPLLAERLGVAGFLQALQVRFADKEQARKAADQICRLGQKKFDGSLSKLYSTFESLTSTPGLEISEQDLLIHFLKAAPEQFQLALFSQGHKDWRSFGRAALDLESKLHVQEAPSEGRKGPSSKGRRRRKGALFAAAASSSDDDAASQGGTPPSGTASSSAADPVVLALADALMGMARGKTPTQKAPTSSKGKGRRLRYLNFSEVVDCATIKDQVLPWFLDAVETS